GTTREAIRPSRSGMGVYRPSSRVGLEHPREGVGDPILRNAGRLVLEVLLAPIARLALGGHDLDHAVWRALDAVRADYITPRRRDEDDVGLPAAWSPGKAHAELRPAHLAEPPVLDVVLQQAPKPPGDLVVLSADQLLQDDEAPDPFGVRVLVAPRDVDVA